MLCKWSMKSHFKVKCEPFIWILKATLKAFLGKTKEVLYLTWNERHLRAYFETLMTLLLS